MWSIILQCQSELAAEEGWEDARRMNERREAALGAPPFRAMDCANAAVHCLRCAIARSCSGWRER